MILSGPLDLLPWSCNTGPTEELIPAVTRRVARCIYVYVLHNVMNLPCCTITLSAEFLQSDCNLKSSLSPSALQYPHKRTHQQCIVTIQDNDIRVPLYWNSSVGVIPSQSINEGSVSPDRSLYLCCTRHLSAINQRVVDASQGQRPGCQWYTRFGTLSTGKRTSLSDTYLSNCNNILHLTGKEVYWLKTANWWSKS